MTMIDTCTWDNPGADRYTGTVAAAVASYGLPIATQRALVDAFERREFADHVVIDRDSIRGQTAEYAPDIRAMHFGSRGRFCGTVTRAKWTTSHAETALVVCAMGECIAYPAVCGNVFRITRMQDSAPLAAPGPQAAADAPHTPGAVDTGAPGALPAEPTGAGVHSTPSVFSGNPIGYVAGGYFASLLVGGGHFLGGGSPSIGGGATPGIGIDVTTPIPAVPEVPTYGLIGIGIAAICVIRRRHR